MNKTLILLGSFLATGMTFAQMTQSTDPASGTTAKLYLCDSNTVTLASVTGNGVTWDYSNLIGIDIDGDGNIETRSLSVSDLDLNSDDSLFNGATKKFVINDQIITYYSTSSTERISQGFTFTEPTLGVVQAFWDTIPQTLNPYPFNFSNVLSDTMSGRIYSNNPPLVIDTFARGNSFATIDGVGTLKLGSTNYANTFRYHFVDTINTFLNLFNQSVTLYRDVYEYYNYTVSPLPILVLYAVKNDFFAPTVVVLSKDEPTATLSVSELNVANDVNIYPNPSRNIFQVSYPKGAKLELMDKAGGHMRSIEGNLIDLTDYSSGVYFLEVDYKGTKISKKLMKL